MRRRAWSVVVVLAMLLVAAGACKSGPPAIAEFKIGKTKDVEQPANTFDARDTVYGVARIDNPPQDGKVTGRLVIVNVEGQQPGPIPGLETTLSLGGVLNTANFTFSPPTAGWPNGQYQMEVILLDAAGAEKDRKTADFTTSGNVAAPAAESAAGDQTPTAAEEGAEPAAGDETQTQ